MYFFTPGTNLFVNSNSNNHQIRSDQKYGIEKYEWNKIRNIFDWKSDEKLINYLRELMKNPRRVGLSPSWWSRRKKDWRIRARSRDRRGAKTRARGSYWDRNELELVLNRFRDDNNNDSSIGGGSMGCLFFRYSPLELEEDICNVREYSRGVQVCLSHSFISSNTTSSSSTSSKRVKPFYFNF